MMFTAVFWVILPCKMIVDRRFRGAYCLHHQGSSLKTALNERYRSQLLQRNLILDDLGWRSVSVETHSLPDLSLVNVATCP
jgi:hypothetical protein